MKKMLYILRNMRIGVVFAIVLFSVLSLIFSGLKSSSSTMASSAISIINLVDKDVVVTHPAYAQPIIPDGEDDEGDEGDGDEGDGDEGDGDEGEDRAVVLHQRRGCSDGEVLGEDNVCHPKPCANGEERNDDGECVRKPCANGEERNDDGECVRKPCANGEERNDDGECVRKPCANGEERVNGVCVAILPQDGGIAPPDNGGAPVIPEIAPSIWAIITAVAALGSGITIYQKIKPSGVEVVTQGGLE
jgi:hypothetical protein